MYYYGARWYDPTLGRFIGCPLGADTIVPNPGDAQTFDRYAYVSNNPLKYTDPTGHCGVSAIAGPIGLVFDLPCWSLGAGEAAAVASVATAPAATYLAVNYVLSEEPLVIPPLYPELAPDAPQGSLLVTIPVPSSTTLVSGIPLVADDVSPIHGSSPVAPVTTPLVDPLPGQTLPVIYPIEISPVAPDWGTKGAHIKVGGVELAVRPGQDGTIVFKPVFSSTGARQLNKAVQEATAQLTGNPRFRQQLYNAVQRGVEYLGQSGNAQWAEKSGELKFLQDALEKLGVQ